MSFYIPNSQYKKYESFDFNGRPSTDASFRNAFIQSQAPMLLGDSGGGGGGGGGLTSVVTNFPVTGDGTPSDPITFAPAPACGRTFFWNGTVWQQSRNTGITEVTVGNTATGANYSTIQAALACSSFIRVVDNTTEPLPLVVSNQNIMIYVDPGVNLTLSDIIADRTSLTFRGSASQSSSLITFRSSIQCDANTRLYFYDCRVINAAGKSLIITNTANYGYVEAYHSNFVAANTINSLFGEGKSETIVLELQDCAIESGGDGCQYFIGTSRANQSIIHIRGLNVLRTVFANKAVLADTNVNECILSDINIFAAGDPNVPYEWFTSGMVTNFKQATGASSVNLRFTGNTVDASNLYVSLFTVASTATNINNVQTTSISTITLSTPETILSNAVFNGTLAVTGDNCKITNMACVRLFVTGTGCALNNVRTSASTDISNLDDTVLTNVFSPGGFSINACGTCCFSNCSGGGFTLISSSSNTFTNCVATGLSSLDSGSSNNTFTGGQYGQVSVIDGNQNSFSNMNCSGGIILSGTQTSPRCIITGCRVAGATGIDVNSNTDVVITNCIVGQAGGGAITITNIVGVVPGPLCTLISNCKTEIAIAASTAVVNCSTF
jgi:hypothetical protein